VNKGLSKGMIFVQLLFKVLETGHSIALCRTDIAMSGSILYFSEIIFLEPDPYPALSQLRGISERGEVPFEPSDDA